MPVYCCFLCRPYSLYRILWTGRHKSERGLSECPDPEITIAGLDDGLTVFCGNPSSTSHLLHLYWVRAFFGLSESAISLKSWMSVKIMVARTAISRNFLRGCPVISALLASLGLFKSASGRTPQITNLRSSHGFYSGPMVNSGSFSNFRTGRLRRYALADVSALFNSRVFYTLKVYRLIAAWYQQ